MIKFRALSTDTVVICPVHCDKEHLPSFIHFLFISPMVSLSYIYIYILSFSICSPQSILH